MATFAARLQQSVLWTRFRRFRRTLTGRDFNYVTDHFFGLDLLMIVAGMRLEAGDSRVRRRLWTLYRWLIRLPLVVVAWNLVQNLMNGAKVDLVLSCLMGVVGGFVTEARVLMILWYYGPLMEVRTFVNQSSIGRNLEPSLGIRSAAFYHNRRLVIQLVTAMMGLTLCCFAIDMSNFNYFKLPFDVGQAFPLLQVICERSIYILLMGFAMMISVSYATLDMMFTSLTAEVQIISLLFAEILRNAEKRTQRRLELEPGSSQPSTGAHFWNFIQQDFADCVALHVEFLAITDKVRPLLNATFLIIHYSTALILASGAIYLSQLHTVTMFSLQTLLYCLGTALECYLLTRLVSRLAETNESIAQQIYQLDWHQALQYEELHRGEYRNVRKMVTVVMAVAQQPLRLNCFGLFEFTPNKFYELLNMAYSLYTFFANFV